MEKTPAGWAYSALVGMSLVMAGWLWQMVGVLRDDVHRLQEVKADKTQAADRWTGDQQKEYKIYVEARLADLTNEIRRYHSSEKACK